MPILASIICLLGVIFIKFIKKESRKRKKMLDKLYMIFLISCFLFYPMATKCSLSMVNCISLDDSDQTFLLASPNIPCWEGFHAKTFIFVGLLGIICWGLFFPIMLGVIIGKQLRKTVMGTRNANPALNVITSSLNSEDDRKGHFLSSIKIISKNFIIGKAPFFC